MKKVISLVLDGCNPDVRVLKEARVLNENGFKASVLAVGERDSTEMGVPVKRVRLRHQKAPLKYFEFWEKALKVLREEKPDIVHCNDLNTLYAGVMAKRELGCKLVYDSHEDFPAQIRGSSGLFLSMPFYAAERLWIGKCDAILTATTHIAEVLRRRYGVRSTVLLNCPSARDMRFSPIRNYKTVGYAGALSEKRGLEQLVAAADYVEPGTRIVIVGGGPLQPLLEKLAAGKDNIKIVGKVPYKDVAKWVASFTIGCILYLPDPNHVYATPNKLFDYMACGRPMLVSDFPHYRQFVSGIGRAVDPTKPREIGLAINDLLSDRKRLTQYSKEARKRFVKKYNWETESRKLLAVYNKV